jgi:hypothetical protein
MHYICNVPFGPGVLDTGQTSHKGWRAAACHQLTGAASRQEPAAGTSSASVGRDSPKPARYAHAPSSVDIYVMPLKTRSVTNPLQCPSKAASLCRPEPTALYGNATEALKHHTYCIHSLVKVLKPNAVFVALEAVNSHLETMALIS